MDRRKKLAVSVSLGLLLMIAVLMVIYLTVIPRPSCSQYSVAPLVRFTFRVVELRIEPEMQKAPVAIQIGYTSRICPRAGFSFTMGDGGVYKSWVVTTSSTIEQGGLRVKREIEYQGDIECFLWTGDKWKGMNGIGHFNFIGADDGIIEVSADCRSWPTK